MKTYALIFCWIPIAAAFMGTGQPGFGSYFFWSLVLTANAVNACARAFHKAGEESHRRIDDEMKLAALLSETETEWNQRCLAHDLFCERGTK